MKKYITSSLAIAGMATLIVGISFAPIASAQSLGASVGLKVSANATTGLSANATAKLTALVTKAQARADQEITRRIDALNALNTRINAMVKLSASDKSSLSATIQSQLTAMTNLQAQVASDTQADATSSLKIDIQSITKSYRIFALIIPQGAIEAAADRVLDIASSMTALAPQLQARITTAQSAGANMNTSVTALADMNAKVADANTQANAAVSEIASLQPDNGDTTIMASNTAALKDARTKIQAGQQDLVAARKDAGTIVKALLALKGAAAGSATSSVGVSASGTVTTGTTTTNQ
jgi:hypothetical protein